MEFFIDPNDAELYIDDGEEYPPLAWYTLYIRQNIEELLSELFYRLENTETLPPYIDVTNYIEKLSEVMIKELTDLLNKDMYDPKGEKEI